MNGESVTGGGPASTTKTGAPASERRPASATAASAEGIDSGLRSTPEVERHGDEDQARDERDDDLDAHRSLASAATEVAVRRRLRRRARRQRGPDHRRPGPFVSWFSWLVDQGTGRSTRLALHDGGGELERVRQDSLHLRDDLLDDVAGLFERRADHRDDELERVRCDLRRRA